MKITKQPIEQQLNTELGVIRELQNQIRNAESERLDSINAVETIIEKKYNLSNLKKTYQEKMDSLTHFVSENKSKTFQNSKTLKLINGTIKTVSGRNSVTFINEESDAVYTVLRNDEWATTFIKTVQTIKKSEVLDAYIKQLITANELNDMGISIKKSDDSIIISL